jgi:hypothetical protein
MIKTKGPAWSDYVQTDAGVFFDDDLYEVSIKEAA